HYELFFFSGRRRHTRWPRDWSSDVCSSDLLRGIYPWSGTTQQVVQITLPDSILGPGPYPIDSLGPAEAAIGFGQPAAICAPPRPWALWSAQSPAITAFSRQDAGELDITRLDTVA